ncbi:hypothetical protein [Acidithiobacillus albertensis]|uniref:hypothetical protein n=1 Tax=Acidithiobacillus albertensis TaxID=119978 RepID=UPI001C06EAB9|nr:hypothetical protein [Acidithiobacillus albertensis]MBU2740906.1 hypothetical protein [Acidithiobacillus albertensis]
MKALKILKGIVWHGILYSLGATVVTWLLVFGVAVYRYHYMGFHPGHIAWLAVKPMPWSETLHQAAHIAGIWAVIALGAGVAITLAFNLFSGLILLVGMAIGHKSKEQPHV